MPSDFSAGRDGPPGDGPAAAPEHIRPAGLLREV
jgi:hypothetical protein